MSDLTTDPHAALVARLGPILEQMVNSAVDAALRQAGQWRIVPGTIDKVNGPDAEVIADDLLDIDPEEIPELFVHATRLDDRQGVAGGIAGGRNRTLMLLAPGGAAYCLGVIPDARPEDTTDSEGWFRSDVDDAFRAAGVATDMQITMDLTAGYSYGVWLHSNVTPAAASTQVVSLDQDGTVIGQFGRMAATAMVDSCITFIAAEDAEASVFTVKATATNTSTISMRGSTEDPRTLMGLCFGPARGTAIG